MDWQGAVLIYVCLLLPFLIASFYILIRGKSIQFKSKFFVKGTAYGYLIYISVFTILSKIILSESYMQSLIQNPNSNYRLSDFNMRIGLVFLITVVIQILYLRYLEQKTERLKNT